MNYYGQGYYPSGYPYQNFQNLNQNLNYGQMPPPTSQGLPGKMVDSIDVVRATEVPIGGYGIFPRGDFSEIYIKTWNNNGTTSVSVFKPYINQEEDIEKESSNKVLERLSRLEEKIDSLIN